MAAYIIDEDERLEELETHEDEVVADLEETPVHEPEEATHVEEEEVPEKYRNKSMAELIRMHQEAEKLVGRQSSEVGDLRKVVDNYIHQQTQLSHNNAPKQEVQEDIDFFDDPEKAIERAISNHPKIREAEELNKRHRMEAAKERLNARHPDMQSILGDAKFAEWVQSSKIRTQLFVQADRAYDFDAADELFTLWKERQGTVAQAAAAEKQARKATAKSASAGNARGNPDSAPRKIYRRADIIKLMQSDPERYEAMSEEIMRAYAEGRVK